MSEKSKCLAFYDAVWVNFLAPWRKNIFIHESFSAFHHQKNTKRTFHSIIRVSWEWNKEIWYCSRKTCLLCHKYESLIKVSKRNKTTKIKKQILRWRRENFLSTFSMLYKNFNKANKLPVWLLPAAQITMLRVKCKLKSRVIKWFLLFPIVFHGLRLW